MRQKGRIGKREREARKRRKRSEINFFDSEVSERRTLKLGRKKMAILTKKLSLPF